MNAVVNIRQGEVRGSVADGVNVIQGHSLRGATVWRQSAPAATASRALERRARRPHLWPEGAPAAVPPPVAALIPDPAIPGEDCLNLNIWSPRPRVGQATGDGLDSWRHV